MLLNFNFYIHFIPKITCPKTFFNTTFDHDINNIDDPNRFDDILSKMTKENQLQLMMNMTQAQINDFQKYVKQKRNKEKKLKRCQQCCSNQCCSNKCCKGECNNKCCNIQRCNSNCNIENIEEINIKDKFNTIKNRINQLLEKDMPISKVCILFCFKIGLYFLYWCYCCCCFIKNKWVSFCNYCNLI